MAAWKPIINMLHTNKQTNKTNTRHRGNEGHCSSNRGSADINKHNQGYFCGCKYTYRALRASLLCRGWRMCASDRSHHPLGFWRAHFWCCRKGSADGGEKLLIKKGNSGGNASFVWSGCDRTVTEINYQRETLITDKSSPWEAPLADLLLHWCLCS